MAGTGAAPNLQNKVQRLRARKAAVGGQRGEAAVGEQGGFELAVILAAREFARAEHLEMIGHELRVEQHEAARAQSRDQMHERDLRGVAHAVEHALAEEGAAETYPVEPADKLAAVVDLD